MIAIWVLTERFFCPAHHKAQPLLRTAWVLLPKVSQAGGLLHIFFSDSKRKVVEPMDTLLVALLKPSYFSIKAFRIGNIHVIQHLHINLPAKRLWFECLSRHSEHFIFLSIFISLQIRHLKILIKINAVQKKGDLLRVVLESASKIKSP